MTAKILQFPLKQDKGSFKPGISTADYANQSVFHQIHTCTECKKQSKMLSIFADAQFCSKECFYKHVGW